MRKNRLRPRPRTHEDASAARLDATRELRRSIMSCMLWEGQFYESGTAVADRIADLIPRAKPDKVAEMAVDAREKMKLRHVPLFLCRELARAGNLHAETLARVIQRADELAEFVALYWEDGRCPLSSQVKKGLAKAFQKFNAYQLAKYNRDGLVKLRDVMFLVHPKPVDDEQEEAFKKLAEGTLDAPDTWEVTLSKADGVDKKDKWTRLLKEKKLGGFALIRNLRNMIDAKVPDKLITRALIGMKVGRILPFRFIAAANHAPRFEPELEKAMLTSLESMPKLPGKTVLLVDVSGSMVGTPISERSQIDRLDAAAGLTMLVRELCETPRIYAFSNTGRHSHTEGAFCKELPARHGFALRDSLVALHHGGTPLGWAIKECQRNEAPFDRIIVLTDEQSGDPVGGPGGRGYMVNVAAYNRGVGYGDWHHIDGWSEAVLDYIMMFEDTEEVE